eukprot:COSAG04_NODE_20531_length_391_cov_1.109589_1_plen_104_part_00
MKCTFCWEGFGPVLAARAPASTTAVSRTDLDWVSVLQLETRLAVEVYGVQHLLRMLIAKPELRAVAPTDADYQTTKVRTILLTGSLDCSAHVFVLLKSAAQKA